MATPVKRLLKQFSPRHYELSLKINSGRTSFSGTVKISGTKLGPPSQRVVFHQKDLKISSAKITRILKNEPEPVHISRMNTHKRFDELRLHASSLLRPGDYEIEISFSGKITKEMNGIYPCFFKDKAKDKQLIATQFESHYARQVFPCIDEPAAKATFKLTLTSPKGESVLSNTPIIKQTVKGDQAITVFDTTPKMSTYLLAFAFGELDYLESKTKSGTIVRTYATKSNVKSSKFALDTAVKCLDFYAQYFGIAFPLAKCDLLALPDFAAGAMENWGLITFREETMLVDPDRSSLAAKQYVSLVVAHELAHQWFGNLVTMRWWTDLWLNEGFASWMEYFAIDHIFPDWKLWVQFAVDEQQKAFVLDSLSNTHPIEVPINHPDEIRTVFDSISYSKGSSIINMLHNYIGASNFQEGLRYYLNNHAYSNTDTVDLWKSFDEVSDKQVEKFMHIWTSKPGYPLVKVNVTDDQVVLAQERFFVNQNNEQKDHTVWPIGLLPSQASLPDTLVLKHKVLRMRPDFDLMINKGQSGFYRTIYNASHLEELGHLIKRSRMEPIDRLGILSNVFETAKAGESDTVDALHFISNFVNEDNYAVWDIIAASLVKIRHIMDDPSVRANIKPYIVQLVDKQLNRLGWDRKNGDSHFDRLLRPIVIALAASADQPDIIAKCQKLFSQIKSTNRHTYKIDPDLKGIVFRTVARKGGTKEFNKFLNMHKSSTLPEERNNLSAALQSFRQESLIAKALGLIKTDVVRLQDVPFWIAYGFANRHSKQQTWQWVKHNWEWLDKNMGSDLSFHRLPVHAAYAFSDKEFITDYKRFFMPLITPVIDRSFKQGLEILDYQTNWRQRSVKEVINFFAQSNKA